MTDEYGRGQGQQVRINTLAVITLLLVLILFEQLFQVVLVLEIASKIP